jgi:hypothetical protein
MASSAYTRRHNCDVAEILGKRHGAFDAEGSGPFAVDWIADDFYDLFAADNPRFDRERFLTACGIGQVAS